MQTKLHYARNLQSDSLNDRVRKPGTTCQPSLGCRESTRLLCFHLFLLFIFWLKSNLIVAIGSCTDPFCFVSPVSALFALVPPTGVPMH